MDRGLPTAESDGGEALLAIAFLFCASLIAGAINVLAGGGGLLVFPSLLLAGIAPISANATSAVGIWVGTAISSWAYRQALKPLAPRLWPLTLISLAGAGTGAWLLLHFSDEGFAQVVPYLVALGTLLFAIAPKLSRFSANRSVSRGKESSIQHKSDSAQPTLNQPALLIGQALISIYGGFFGGGAGILMLTLLSLTNPGKLQTLQAVKLWMALCINAAAISYFLLVDVISWPYAMVVAAGTSLGGYSSVYVAKRISTVWLRRFVIVIGTVLSGYFFVATR